MIGVGKEYWEKEWDKRIEKTNKNGVGYVKRNPQKFSKLFYEMTKRPHLMNLEKIDVGCGPSSLAVFLGMFDENFLNTYTGIDLSENAVKWCTDYQINAVQGDFLNYPFNKKFSLFMFWDVLEHIPDHETLAQRIKELANDDFYIVGNIPLYLSDHINHEDGFEQAMDVNKLLKFIKQCGGIGFHQEIYGCFGMPYMFFEAHITK